MWKMKHSWLTVSGSGNPLTDDFFGLSIGFDTSGAEQIAAKLPASRVVKALNAVLAPNHDPASFPPHSLFVPVSGDDPAAVQAAISYLDSLGFDAVTAGELKNARYIEPFTELLVQLAYFQGFGTAIGVTLQRGQ